LGDESTSNLQNPGTHEYIGSGTYTIELSATNGKCSDSKLEEVIIRPMVPIASIDVDPSSGCPPLIVNFSNYTEGATNYLWEFGDGGLSQEIAPTHTYLVPGNFKVKLTATGPGGTDISEDVTIEVFENPFAQFEVVPKVLYLPAKPVFINRSVGATIYEWDFGDGNTSTEFSPNHLYEQPGFYTISLKVKNSFGCTDQSTLNEAIKVEPGGEIKFPNAFTPSPSGPSSGKYTYGDPTNHVFYPFTQKGIVEYQLQIFTRWGEIIFESDDIEVGWDGYVKEKLAPQGVYIWRAKYKTADGKVEIKAGDVTVIW
jgi:PKD repeat protein